MKTKLFDRKTCGEEPLGELSASDLTVGKVYEVLSVEKGWYKIVDDSGEDYLYPPELLEIVEE